MFAPQENTSSPKQHQEQALSSIELQEHASSPKQHEEQQGSPPTEQEQPLSTKEETSDDTMSTEQSNLGDKEDIPVEAKDGTDVEEKVEGEKEVVEEEKVEDVEMKETGEESSPVKEEPSGMEETPVLTPAEETSALTPGGDNAPGKEETPVYSGSSGLTDNDYWSEVRILARYSELSHFIQRIRIHFKLITVLN